MPHISMTTKIKAIGLLASHLGTGIRELGFVWTNYEGGVHILEVDGASYTVDLVIDEVRPVVVDQPTQTQLKGVQ